MNKEEFLKLFKGTVEIDPDRHGGQPVLKDTRFPISQLMAELSDKYEDELIWNFDFDPKDVKLFFKCLSQFLSNPPIKE